MSSTSPARGEGRGVVVAQLASGVQLRANDRGSSICTQLSGRVTVGGGFCTRPPAYAPEARLGGDEAGTVHYGVVPVDVAAVEVETVDGTRARADTFAGESYHGRFAGRIRFALVETTAARKPFVLVRFLDAAGQVIGAQGAETSFNPLSGLAAGPVTVAPRTFKTGRHGRAEVFGRSMLAPTPFELDRTETLSCIGFSVRRGGRPARALAGACVDAGPVRYGVHYATDPTCHGTGLVGIAADRVRRVTAVLGDGRRVRIRLRRLPVPLRQDVRAFAMTLPPHVALLRLIARSASGDASLLANTPPGSLKCFPLPDDDDFVFPVDLLPAFAALRRPSTRLRVGDAGERLCLATSPSPVDLECALPPVKPEGSFFPESATRRRTVIAVIGSPQVASASVRLAGETTSRPLPRSATLLARSRYRAVLPAFELVLPGHRKVDEIIATDTAGRHVRHRGVQERGLGGTIARIGPVRLRATRFGPESPCLSLSSGRGVLPMIACVDTSTSSDTPRGVAVLAACAPRRILLATRLPTGAHTLAVRLRSGARITGRAVRIPRSAGGGRAGLVVLGPRQQPTALTLPGSGRAPRHVRIPTAAEQCGWWGQVGLPP